MEKEFLLKDLVLKQLELKRQKLEKKKISKTKQSLKAKEFYKQLFAFMAVALGFAIFDFLTSAIL